MFWLVARVDDVLGVIRHDAAHKLKEGISHFQVVHLDIFIRVKELHVERQINLLKHLLVGNLKNTLSCLQKSLLQYLVLPERHLGHLRLHQHIVRCEHLAVVKLNSDDLVFKIEHFEAWGGLNTNQEWERCIKDVNCAQRKDRNESVLPLEGEDERNEAAYGLSEQGFVLGDKQDLLFEKDC